MSPSGKTIRSVAGGVAMCVAVAGSMAGTAGMQVDPRMVFRRSGPRSI